MNAVKLIRAPEVRAAPSGARRISGIASTANRDRHGETVDPRGITWRLPVPLLAGHDHRSPIGKVVSLEASHSELRFTAEVSSATEHARQMQALIDDGTLWGVSIGFLGVDYEARDKGLHWKSAELLEVSIVSVPSNRESRILSTTAKAAEPTPPKHAPGAGAVRLLKR